MKRILVCTDGEEHTHGAESQAMELARALGASIVGLYVLSPYLKKFTDEIYAVNRNECRAHLDDSLRREGDAALAALGRQCAERGLEYSPLMRYGDIADEIVDEAAGGDYLMLVMGSKLLKGWRERLESCNVAQDVFRRVTAPVLFVR